MLVLVTDDARAPTLDEDQGWLTWTTHLPPILSNSQPRGGAAGTDHTTTTKATNKTEKSSSTGHPAYHGNV